ncbi:MAG: CCC motif membrane protein [Flavobacteriales bacterium]
MENMNSGNPPSWGNNPYGYNMRNSAPLPNVTTALVLAILSVFLCCCYGVPGLITSIVALFLANNALKLNRQNPEEYRRSDVSNAGVARIIAIIGIVLSSLGTLYFIVYVILLIVNPDLANRNDDALKDIFD